MGWDVPGVGQELSMQYKWDLIVFFIMEFLNSGVVISLGAVPWM